MAVRRLPTWLPWFVPTVVLAVLVGFATGRVAELRAVAALHASAQADAKLRAALLDSEIARYRLLPVALADDSDVRAALAEPARRRALDRKLEALGVATGAAVIYVVGRDGIAIAASNWRTPLSFVGRDFGIRSYVRAARAMGYGDQFARGIVSRRSGLFISHRTATGGVIVVKLEFDAIERQWAGAGGETLVADRAGVVLVASRATWHFGLTRALPPAAIGRFAREKSIDPASLRPLPLAPGRDGEMRIGRARYVAATAATAQPGWTLLLLRPVRPAVDLAIRTAAFGAAAAVVLVAALLWLVAGRRARTRARTGELEAAVAARTVALEREIEVRAASEAHAAELREGLRQANRLATLGQVTAGVAHETAQPVAAIRTFAQTGAMLLDRGDAGGVRDNLAAIARLADRIGDVTTELRGFARRGTREVRAVPLAPILDGAMLILRDQLRPIALTRPVIDTGFAVRGGRVRLEQVLVNLLQNAVEALAETPDPVIAIALAVDADHVRLTVADNGPGIPAAIAERLFTPFVTSRENGLGLGLVIAQDIMTDLGGSLRLVPSDRGAAFEVGMRRA